MARYPYRPVEGYSVTEAASVLGVPTERVWELLARGILSGAPEGETGMRVFLQPRPVPRAAIEEPRAGNGNATPRPPEVESSPFRELLTEFRNLTERYGQALLALGESRGEVASLRSRVDLLEARVDLRLPMSAPMPEPGSRSRPRAVVEPAAEEVGESAAASAAEHDAEEPPRRKRRSQRRVTDEFADALARAEDPTPAELPGAADAAAAYAALRDEARPSVEPEADVEAALPRDLPAAEPMLAEERAAASEADVEPPVATVSEPVAGIHPPMEPETDEQSAVTAMTEPVSPGGAEPAEAAIAEEVEAAAGTVVRFETAAEPELTVEAAPEVEPAPSAPPELEPAPEPAAAWDVPADVEGEGAEEWVVRPAEPTSDAVPVDEPGTSWPTSVADEGEPVRPPDADVAGAPADLAPAEAPAPADEWTTSDELSWDRRRYTTEIEEPDWIPEEPSPAAWSGQPPAYPHPDSTVGAAGDRIELEAFGGGQEETDRWFASGQDLSSTADEPSGDDQPVPEVDASPEAAIERPEPAPIEDPAEEMEVAGASGHAPSTQPAQEVDEERVEPAAPTAWAPAPSPLPAWAERFPSPSPTPTPESQGTPTVETGPASRAYRRLRRIFPG